MCHCIDTYAAKYQARMYQGRIPEDSLFAKLQRTSKTMDNSREGRGEKESSVVLRAFSWACMIASVAVLFF